jgi:hypothetical protein
MAAAADVHILPSSRDWQSGLVEAQPEWVLEFPDIWNVKPMVPGITAFIEDNYEEEAVLTSGQVLFYKK